MKWQVSKKSIADSYIKMSPGSSPKRFHSILFTVQASRHIHSNSFIYFSNIAEFDHLQVALPSFFHCPIFLLQTTTLWHTVFLKHVFW